MADSQSFELACEVLQRSTSLDRLEARGTIRLALKTAGLDARDVTAAQMGAVVDQLLPRELKTRGIENGDAVCAELKAGLQGIRSPAAAETPEAIFARLGAG
jgi:hypothetical protein